MVWEDKLQARFREALPPAVAQRIRMIHANNDGHHFSIVWRTGAVTDHIPINQLFADATIARVVLECP